MSTTTSPGPYDLTDAATSSSLNPRWRETVDAAGKSCGQIARHNVGHGERVVSALVGAALTGAGMKRGGAAGILLGFVGGSLLYRGASGHCNAYDALGIDTAEHSPATVIASSAGVKVESAVTINRSPNELYTFWRNLETLPFVMRHLKSVEKISDSRSRWTAAGPLGKEVSWEAEIFNDRENELIAWRSVAGSDIETAGSVRFQEVRHDRGTRVIATLQYKPTGGKLIDRVATLFGGSLEDRLLEDLRNLKRFMEAGEIPTTHGQSHGNRSLIGRVIHSVTDLS